MADVGLVTTRSCARGSPGYSVSVRPLILLSPATQRTGPAAHDYFLTLSDSYCQAVVAGGGAPVVAQCLPLENYVASVVERADGVMLSGGDDIRPELYRKSLPFKVRETCGPHDPNRDLFELMLIAEVFRQRKPLLAICRGFQMVNIALGGTLYTDIALEHGTTFDHSRFDLNDKVVHPMSIEKGCHLHGILGTDSIGVNSTHHQAIRELAAPLRATAWSPEGIIEAIELAQPGDLPWFAGLQFHPERLFPTSKPILNLFRHFVAACQQKPA